MINEIMRPTIKPYLWKIILIEPTVDIRIRIRGCENSHIRIRIRIRIRGCQNLTSASASADVKNLTSVASLMYI